LNPNDEDLIQRIRRDLADGYDEELELGLEDRNLYELAESAIDTLQRNSSPKCCFASQGTQRRLHAQPRPARDHRP